MGSGPQWGSVLILVTGAAGKTGRAVIRTLAAGGCEVRGLVRRGEQVASLERLGATEVVVGDLRDRAEVDRAMIGARSCYHICPNVHPEEASIGSGVIASAREAEVERFVFHSVLHPQTRAMPHHWAKLEVEEKLFESGLGYVILQPCAYMQNVLGSWTSIVEGGTYVVPYRAETEISMIDLEDVAEVARRALTEDEHLGATYELCGPERLNQTEVAAILSRHLQRSVRVVVESTDEWSERARRSSLDDRAISLLVRMFAYYDRFGFSGSSRVTASLLGRRPTSFAEFTARIASDNLGETEEL